MTRTLAVLCPRWSVVAADLAPDIPAAAFHANRVVVASSEAQALGIRRGMRRREAQARAPDLEVLRYDPAADARAFEPVVAAVESFSPKVEIVRPGLVIVPARGPARYFGGEDALRKKVARKVDATLTTMRTHPLHADDRSRCGIAPNAFAASVAAQRSTVIPAGAAASFLAPFPVSVLDLPDLAEVLVRLGIRTLGELAALPVHSVVARFGSDGELAHRLARGDDDRLLAPREPPPDLAVTRELDPPAANVDVATFAGKAAADELAQRLSELALGCSRIGIELETEHGESHQRTWRYFGALTPPAVTERIRWQLEAWLQSADPPSGGVSLLRLRPDEVGRLGSQVGFWGRSDDATHRIRRALGRIQSMLGHASVVQPVISGGRHPSEQAALVPWGDPVEPERPGLPGAQTVRGPIAVELPVWPGRLPRPSPAVVHEQPLACEVVDERGESVGVTGRSEITASPTRVRVGGTRWSDVLGWSGPWPTDERWWDGSAHRRRARFQVALADGHAHLLALENGRWHVEATYD